MRQSELLMPWLPAGPVGSGIAEAVQIDRDGEVYASHPEPITMAGTDLALIAASRAGLRIRARALSTLTTSH